MAAIHVEIEIEEKCEVVSLFFSGLCVYIYIYIYILYIHTDVPSQFALI